MCSSGVGKQNKLFSRVINKSRVPCVDEHRRKELQGKSGCVCISTIHYKAHKRKYVSYLKIDKSAEINQHMGLVYHLLNLITMAHRPSVRPAGIVLLVDRNGVPQLDQ